MYQIIINGEVVSDVLLPCYVMYDKKIKSFCTCEYERAEAVLVYVSRGEIQDNFYADLAEKEIRHEGFPIATIVKIGE